MNLWERFSRGDIDAFERLFDQFHAEVHGWLLRLVRDRAAADDLTIDVFWRIYRARARFDPTRSFGAWARRIASNAAIDYLRAHRRFVSVAAGGPVAPAAPSAARRDVQLRVERAFLRLPGPLRVVAELALIGGWPNEEIADTLGISRTAVKFRLVRARRFLKKALHEEGISA